jgi:hypothetical protein
MSKKPKKAKARREHSPAYYTSIWFGSLLSLLLLWFAANAVVSDAQSLRSCNANSAGLTVSNCGKSSINPGDLVILALFVLSAALSVTLFTAAWRTVKRKTT